MYIWTYQRPARFQESNKGNYIIKMQNNAKDVYLCKKNNHHQSITRLEVIAITAGVLFFLRLIICNYPKKLYADCLQFNNTTYTTYQQAAVAAGIVRDNVKVYTCFEEAEQKARR